MDKVTPKGWRVVRTFVLDKGTMAPERPPVVVQQQQSSERPLLTAPNSQFRHGFKTPVMHDWVRELDYPQERTLATVRDPLPPRRRRT